MLASCDTQAAAAQIACMLPDLGNATARAGFAVLLDLAAVCDLLSRASTTCVRHLHAYGVLLYVCCDLQAQSPCAAALYPEGSCTVVCSSWYACHCH